MRWRDRTPEDRFWSRVNKTETCWLWTGGSNGRYGGFMVERRQVVVHRWSYERFVGPIPEGKQIDHACGVTLCVNPAHLRPLEAHENVRAYWREQRGTCRAGHDMTDPVNVVWRKGGTQRRCRTCDRARMRRYYLKRSAVTHQ